MNINTKNSLIIFLTFFIYVSFVLGFYFNENSIGSGGYDGDLVWMWNNFEIYKTYDLWTAIHHPDFFGNRTPLLYILHKNLRHFWQQNMLWVHHQVFLSLQLRKSLLFLF